MWMKCTKTNVYVTQKEIYYGIKYALRVDFVFVCFFHPAVASASRSKSFQTLHTYKWVGLPMYHAEYIAMPCSRATVALIVSQLPAWIY